MKLLYFSLKISLSSKLNILNFSVSIIRCVNDLDYVFISFPKYFLHVLIFLELYLSFSDSFCILLLCRLPTPLLYFLFVSYIYLIYTICQCYYIYVLSNILLYFPSTRFPHLSYLVFYFQLILSPSVLFSK